MQLERSRGAVRAVVLASGLALLLAHAANAQAPDIRVKNAWISVPLLDDDPTHAFLLMQNLGKEDRKLVGASSPAAERVEIHRSVVDAQGERTERIDEWEIPKNGQVLFSRGGILLVLVGAQELELGSEVSIELRFAHGAKVTTQAVVKDE